jgi:hypothetical protein
MREISGELGGGGEEGVSVSTETVWRTEQKGGPEFSGKISGILIKTNLIMPETANYIGS